METPLHLSGESALEVPACLILDRALLETFVVDAHRHDQLSRYEVGQLLGLDRWQTEEFLASRGAIRPYDLADLEVDRATLMALR